MKRLSLLGILLLFTFVIFEVFNFSTTEYALRDLLGNLNIFGVTWAVLLSVAFCTIDFVGLGRLFTSEQGKNDPAEVWYLLGGWVLAATMNATLTWWGVSIAIASNVALGGLIGLVPVIPVFIAILVWLIRVLIVGVFSLAGPHLFFSK